MTKISKPTVTVVVPVFNSESFIKDSIQSVLNQSHSHWELVLIDDNSTDSSVSIINDFASQDDRIKFLASTGNNIGAALTRNRGVDYAKGRYIAFLDADDLWLPTKLEAQLRFMDTRESAFSFTGYEFANEAGVSTGKVVSVPEKVSYRELLHDTVVWTSTVMLDTNTVPKDCIKMIDVTIGEDLSTWLRIIKKVTYAHGLNRPLSIYRRSAGSISANKITAAKGRWNLYRNIEGLDFTSSVIGMFWYIKSAVGRRM